MYRNNGERNNGNFVTKCRGTRNRNGMIGIEGVRVKWPRMEGHIGLDRTYKDVRI